MLPENLQAHLTDSRVAGARYGSEQAAVEISVRIVELRVVHHVEKLRAELYVEALTNARVLMERNIPIVETGSVEEPAVGIAEVA
jgi:hypothetical protein